MTLGHHTQDDHSTIAFFPYEAMYYTRRWNDNMDVRPAHYIGVGEKLGRLLKGAAEAVSRYFAGVQVRQQLMNMDDRMLDDIGLTRGDIEAVAAGTYPLDKAVPEAEAPEAAPKVEKPIKVEAILRRAA